MDLFNYKRRRSCAVPVGGIAMGGDNPLRLQSMTDTATTDTLGSARQIERIAAAGADYVRLTTQGVREAENLGPIRDELERSHCRIPLIADVHFNPDVANAAALYADKVRINPGNYTDPARTFKTIEYTDESYAAELQRLRNRFLPLLQLCRRHGRALRIGVNHGSLSDRIMNRYGDTPEGMVESCMEFLRICKEHDFSHVVISIKASNTVVMVRTVRLLVQAMEAEAMDYPLHLGVTEAGEGEDGRIKSAVGIGALLADGLGDTLRVSLSEPPEREIPVARKLAQYVAARAGHPAIAGEAAPGFCYTHPRRRTTHAVGCIGGDRLPVVVAAGGNDPCGADFLYLPQGEPVKGVRCIIPHDRWQGAADTYPLFTADTLDELSASAAPLCFLQVTLAHFGDRLLALLARRKGVVLLMQSRHQNPVGEYRAMVHRLMCAGLTHPALAAPSYNEAQAEDLQVKAAADMGVLCLDGLLDGLMLHNAGAALLQQSVVDTAFGILQATRLRMVKTEYISCPGCGRTLYDLQQTIARIKAATAGCRGLKIGIMGCIVNGPGEMADADYGYVGAARGKVSLYRRKECVQKNIPEAEAVDKLLELMRSDGHPL